MTRIVFIDEELVLVLESELTAAVLLEVVNTDGWVLPAALTALLSSQPPRLRAVRLGRLVVVTPAEPHECSDLPEGLAPVQLSPRQREVLQGTADGLTNKEIALHLGLQERTVEGHIQHIQRRFGTQSRMQSVLRGVALGLCKLKNN